VGTGGDGDSIGLRMVGDGTKVCGGGWGRGQMFVPVQLSSSLVIGEALRWLRLTGKARLPVSVLQRP